nr:hypothetical protein GCM10017745_57430 [Saccharothrix mutabilis subsp. capreolus]
MQRHARVGPDLAGFQAVGGGGDADRAGVGGPLVQDRGQVGVAAALDGGQCPEPLVGEEVADFGFGEGAGRCAGHGSFLGFLESRGFSGGAGLFGRCGVVQEVRDLRRTVRVTAMAAARSAAAVVKAVW